MSLKKIKKFTEQIYSYRLAAKITKDDVGGECKFVADPFVCYDTKSEHWVLFAEVASPARRQHIGMLKSLDLRHWEYHGDAVLGSRESYPFIYECENGYHMIPCIDASAAPGLVAIYKARSLLGSWKLGYQFVLPKPINDRVMMPIAENNRRIMIYGTRSRFGPALEYLELDINEDKRKVKFSNSKILLRTQLITYLKNRFSGSPRAIMRPGGSLIPIDEGYILPIQGTLTGAYGEELALAYIAVDQKDIKIEALDFLDIRNFCPEWSACHHLSFYTHGGKEVVAVDGHSESSDWEVRIFTNK